MPDIIKVKSGSMYEERNSYSRLVAVGDMLFVSNTAGIDYRTREISPDVAVQARRALQTIEGALNSVGSSLADVVRIITHVPDRANMAPVALVLGEVFKGIDPAATMACTPLARDDLKVEFEVTAIRGVSKQPQEYLRISV
ncbi:RidA family protein [Gluconobacter sphaericus]|uniref:RidA family protein n=1 Tax=Gluconobacter sphaericus TaxID=574987 RepID=UPI001B8ACD23|nr:RidA family protein [Gluconobacter sphaericus]MBS1097978.1 RidA family protein [Gluconobacter sphaericus]